jgi:hypothetical protein
MNSNQLRFMIRLAYELQSNGVYHLTCLWTPIKLGFMIRLACGLPSIKVLLLGFRSIRLKWVFSKTSLFEWTKQYSEKNDPLFASCCCSSQRHSFCVQWPRPHCWCQIFQAQQSKSCWVTTQLFICFLSWQESHKWAFSSSPRQKNKKEF